MKTLYILRSFITAIFLLLLLIVSSCTADDTQATTNELDGLVKIQDISNDTHTIELFTKSGTLQQGYNAISLRIKNTTTGEYEHPTTISFNPIMYMTMMTHSCPKSDVVATQGKTTLYNGYIIFQMAQNDMEHWGLTVNYSIDGNAYAATGQISVPASLQQRVTAFTGSDGVKYILALIDPETPRVAVNDMTVALYSMESMTSFSIVDNYSILPDPRMPGMGNHGSPNNVALTQSGTDHLYHGKLALTMTGYWRINLQLLNPAGDVLKGEAITAEVPQSSIYLETEF